MSRRRKWPPTIHTDGKRSRIAWGGRFYTLGKPDSPEARARYLELCRLIEQHGDVPEQTAGGMTVAEVCRWWLRRLPHHYRPTSREPAEHKRVMKVLCELFGHLPAAEFGPKRLRDVLAEFGRRGWSRKVCNRRLTRVKTLLRQAAEEELVPGPAYQACRAVRGFPKGAAGVRDTPDRGPADPAAFAAACGHAPAPVAALLTVERLTGMRPGEARLMMAPQVERLADGCMRYTRTPADGHKGAWLGRTRVVPVGPRAARVLSPWLYAAAEDGGYVFRPGDAPRTGRRAAVRPCYTDATLPQAVRRAARAAGVQLTAYQLRHLWRNEGLDAGSVAAVMQALGQTSTAALDAYGRGATDAGEALSKKIG